MNELLVSDILGFLGIFLFTNIGWLIFYLYLANRLINLEENTVPNIYILEEDMKLLKNETIHINGRISNIDKNIIYVEKGE